MNYPFLFQELKCFAPTLDFTLRASQSLVPTHEKRWEYPICLTIAGSDSSGGAGIQADLKTFSALGCYGASVICALTAQNTIGVLGVMPVPPEFIRQQLESVFSDLNVAAVKIGMLANAQVIAAVAEVLRKYNPQHIILDPVMISQSGHKLLEDDAIAALKAQLMPIATLITPNMPEAAALLGVAEARDVAEMEVQGRALLEQAAQAVLVKGGHGSGVDAVDVLVCSKNPSPIMGEGGRRPDEGEKINRFIDSPSPPATRDPLPLWEREIFSIPRISTPNTHGTGCTLSAAITAYVAQGLPLIAAVESAKAYLTGALEAGQYLHVGKGAGPVHHFYQFYPLT